MINGLDHLCGEGVLQDGGVIGHLYLPGDYGENALEGSRFVANQLGMSVSARPVAKNAAEQITALKAAKAQVVVLTATEAQTRQAVAARVRLERAVPGARGRLRPDDRGRLDP
ncbi:hypothetical protein FKR81_23255 [Lentzea tibetensis]|uniref:Uncharacterized protein n=1 Tax=Lentzea tibetensis TaxID=2591470 RepID=A0A563ERI3_9PSEU|nr:hypothetical protein [Lentzea tibetensis]TWP49471.1 hypothetical protein FKR81_23255 [Lentzea tibetensis]